MKKIFVFFALLLSIWVPDLKAQEVSSDGQKNGKQEMGKITYTGYGYFMFGQIVNGVMGVGIPAPGEVTDKILSHYWQEQGDIDFYLTSRMSDWFTAKAGISLKSYFPRLYGADARTDAAAFYETVDGAIPMAEGIFNWNFSGLSLLVESGLFQYTFNPEVKNLGNYLYRSSVYPLSTYTKIDYPWADLTGARVQLKALENKLTIESIFSSEINFPPWYDWSLGFTATYAPNKIIDFGAGACFAHFVSVGDNQATSDSIKTMYPGTKWTARAIFDPKPIFYEPEIFGSEDLKIYAEAAILGTKNHETYGYLPDSGKISGFPIERTPLLLGINLPCFKIIDLASVELEWFKSPFPNDWYGDYPTPVARELAATDNKPEIDNYLNDDNFKWSVYVKKHISNFEIKFIAANDHTFYKGFKTNSKAYFEQTLKRNKDWHWYLKLQYNL